MEPHRNFTGGLERSITISSESTIDWLNGIMDNMYKSHDSSRNNQSSDVRQKIQKVPEKLSRTRSASDMKIYFPSAVSIGPYHAGEPELQVAEELKPATVCEFARDCEMSISQLYHKVAGMAGDARNYYVEGSTDGFTDEAFTTMLLLDGCFVVHFMNCKTAHRKPQNMKREMLADVHRDLFLLENQLPFEVLDELLSFQFVRGDDRKRFLEIFIRQIRPLIPQSQVMVKNFFTYSETERARDRLLKDGYPIHLLDCLHMLLSGSRCGPQKHPSPSNILKPDRKKVWYSCRSAKEIKATGVHFRPTKSSHLQAVSFESGLMTGTLRLPQVAVDDTTKSILLNLVAYESCPDTRDDYVVTTYISFMSSLITCVDDVKEFRSKGILVDVLGSLSDQHVVDIFNEIGYGLVPNHRLYVDVHEQIEKQSKEKCKIWMKDWHDRNFRTPWTFLGFMAAFYVIILTTVQTYFTIYPSESG